MKIYISATLRGFFGRQESITVPGDTVQKALDALTDEYPDARDALYEEDGTLRPFIHIFVNDEELTDGARWNESFSEADEILLLPAIAGGSGDTKKRESLISDERRKAVSLGDREIDRFNKHLMLREIGVKGQKRLMAAKVVVFGAGALGSPVIRYLAAAGVGSIRIVDEREVLLSDLQSEVLHTARDIGRPKAASAKDKVRLIDRGIMIEAENIRPNAENIEGLLSDADLAIDCTGSFETRYLIGDACALFRVPLVFGAVYQYEGQVSVFNLLDGPCFRCAYPAPPPAGLVPSCAEGGTISPLAGIIGSMMANEALKLIMGIGEVLSGRLLTIDSLYLHSRIVTIHQKETCPVCGAHPVITAVEDFDYEDFCGLSENEDELPVEGIEPEVLAKRIDSNEPLLIVDVREPHERAIHRFPNAVVILIGQLARRQKELDPEVDTIFICKEGKRSILAINTLREAGYKGPMYNLLGGVDAARDIIFSTEGAWL